MDLNRQAESLRKEIEAVREEFGKVIVGNRDILDYMLKALFAGGHILLEGLPGLGKTLMVRTVARLLDLDFSRIQFTPDLMPADILGVNILVEDKGGRRSFHFEKGPVFTNILLADEINRATPKTQSALLQVMEEKHITIFGADHQLDDFFLVLATQNPIELKGTYPLPEAQLDRFMFNIRVGYPSAEEEEQILAAASRNESQEVRKVLSAKAIINLQKLVHSVAVSEYVIKYVSRLVRSTRPKDKLAPGFVKELVDWGAGPRAGQFLIAGGKAMAAMDGRFSVGISDIRKVALPVLRHRVSTNFQAQAEGMTTEDLIQKLLDEIPEPEVAKFEKQGEGGRRK
jgi:MoxR-like ATPase